MPRPKLSKQQTATDLDDESSPLLYNVKMVFEQPSTYLAVPVELFDKILDDDKLILPKISAGKDYIIFNNGKHCALPSFLI